MIYIKKAIMNNNKAKPLLNVEYQDTYFIMIEVDGKLGAFARNKDTEFYTYEDLDLTLLQDAEYDNNESAKLIYDYVYDTETNKIVLIERGVNE